MTDNPVDIVRAWARAAQEFDAEAAVVLMHEDVEFVTMHRGTQIGLDAVRGWVDRQTYGVATHLVPQRYFHRGNTVVVDMLAELREVETGELFEGQARALSFRVSEQRITRFKVHPDLASAFTDTGLRDADAPEPA